MVSSNTFVWILRKTLCEYFSNDAILNYLLHIEVVLVHNYTTEVNILIRILNYFQIILMEKKK